MRCDLNSENKISIYLVEDYLLIRKSLVYMLKQNKKFNILGDFESAEDFLDVFRKKPSDIVIMDLGLPGINGLKATLKVKEISPDTKVIILTSHEEEKEVMATLSAGASAYCLKDVASNELARIITDVYRGVVWLHPQISHVANSKMPKPVSTDLNSLYEINKDLNLTERELETLHLVVEGKTNSEIAQKMNISSHTAKAHVGSILNKLSVSDRVQAAVKAVRTKIV